MNSNSIVIANQQLSTNTQPDEWQRAYVLWVNEFESPHTREAYHRAWEQFYKFSQSTPFDLVTNEQIRAWKIVLQKEIQSASVNQKLSAISSFYVFVNKNYPQLRGDNPAAGVKQLTVNPYGKATLLSDDQDIELLESIARDDDEGIRDYAIILLFLTTGVRLAAVANAVAKDVRRQGATTFFHYVGKRNKEFDKRLPTNTAKAVLEWKGVRPDTPTLFGLKRHQVQYMIKVRCDRIFGKGHGITVHSLRHTAATNAAKVGSVQDVRSLLDHESTRVTTIYLDHVNKEQGERMSELLDERYK